MFGFFKSDESIRNKFVDKQNYSYRINGHKAIASSNKEVYKVLWELKYMANQIGYDLNRLEYEITSNKNKTQFPETSEDFILKKILIENKFNFYEVSYRTPDNRILLGHKTRLI